LGIAQALDLSKAHAHNRAMEVAQGVCIAELESDNTKFLSELEQARRVLAEADAAWGLLSTDREKFE
jgi:hypothetical protein